MRTLLFALRLALSSINAYRLRSALTGLGVTMGVTTVIAILSIIEGLDRSFQDTVASMGTGTLYVTQRPWIILNDWWKYKDRPPLSDEDAEHLDERLELAKLVVPFVFSRVSIDVGDATLKGIRVIGSTQDWSAMSGVTPNQGRFLSRGDVEANRPFVVVGRDVVETLRRQGLGVNDTIEVGGFPMRVIGELPGRGRVFGRSQDDMVVIPIGLFERLYGFRRSVQIGVIGEPSELTALEAEITGALRVRRRLGPGDEDNFSINQQDMLVDLYRKLTSSLYATAIGLGIITLIVAGVGIMNIMLVAVAERTREIGIRKALGARPNVILAQFLVEATLVSVLGGAAGTALGGGLAALIASATPLPAAVPPVAIAIGLGFGAFVGVVFGLVPATRAANMTPVAALAQGG